MCRQELHLRNRPTCLNIRTEQLQLLALRCSARFSPVSVDDGISARDPSDRAMSNTKPSLSQASMNASKRRLSPYESVGDASACFRMLLSVEQIDMPENVAGCV